MKNLLNYKGTYLILIFLIAFYNYINNNLEILDNIRNFKTSLIFFLYFLSFINYLLKAKINVSLYNFLKINLDIFESLLLIIKSAAINLSSPVNLGTGYKFYYLKKNYNLDYFDNFSINTAYAIFLNFAYILFIALLLVFQSSFLIYIKLLITFLFIVIIFFLIFFFKKLETLTSFKNKNSFWSNVIKRFINGFLIFKNEKHNSLRLFFDTLIYNGITFLYIKFIFYSFGLDVQIKSIILLHFLSSIINIVKLTPGNIGILEVFLIFFQGIHGVSTNEIILLSICSRILSFSSILIILLIEKFKLKS